MQRMSLALHFLHQLRMRCENARSWSRRVARDRVLGPTVLTASRSPLRRDSDVPLHPLTSSLASSAAAASCDDPRSTFSSSIYLSGSWDYMDYNNDGSSKCITMVDKCVSALVGVGPSGRRAAGLPSSRAGHAPVPLADASRTIRLRRRGLKFARWRVFVLAICWVRPVHMRRPALLVSLKPPEAVLGFGAGWWHACGGRACALGFRPAGFGGRGARGGVRGAGGDVRTRLLSRAPLLPLPPRGDARYSLGLRSGFAFAFGVGLATSFSAWVPRVAFRARPLPVRSQSLPGETP